MAPWSRAAAVVGILVALASCARPSTSHSPHESPAAARAVDRKTTPKPNSIDRLVQPRLAALGITTPRAEAHELCRRLAIDILGRGPNPSELQQCTGSVRSIDTIVDAWMARPEHELNERRAWSELIEYDVTATWYGYIVDADALVGSLASGKLGYDDFAARFIIHPAFYSQHPDDDWTRMTVSLFLGRTARPDEVRALRPLVGIWADRTFSDAKLSSSSPQPERPTSRELGFDFCNCDKNIVGGCTSRAFGPTIDLRGCVPVVRPKAPTPTPTPTSSKKRPAAMQEDPEILAVPNPTMVRTLAIGGETDPIPRTTADQEARLLSIGGALATRADFWEAAVDREMRKYLGWWQTGFKRPETDLPDVRAALAAELARTKSIRALRRTILTSVLYTMPATERADLPKAASAMRWTNGPRKLLSGEAWMDTMGLAVGEHLGSCDHRFFMPIAYEGGNSNSAGGEDLYDVDGMGVRGYRFVDPALTPPAVATMIDPQKLKPFDYTTAARRIGGCGGGGRSPASSLGLAQAQREIAGVLCAGGQAVKPTTTPDSQAGAFEADARALTERMLARPASEIEARRLASEMRECMRPRTKDKGDSTAPCSSRGVAIRWLCTRIATSAEFGTY